MRRETVICLVFAAVALLTGAGSVQAQLPETLQKARPIYRQDTLSICLMGDMMMHTAQIENARSTGGTYDFSSYFRHLEDRIAQADIAVANMEFTLAGEPHTGYPHFSAPDSYAEYLADCGFDVFLTANNHIFDKGSQGAARTLDRYKDLSDRYGIRYCGLASDSTDRADTYPLIIKAKGIRIAFINFTYGTNLGADMLWPRVNYMNDKSRLKDALGRSTDADFVLALPHWGTEYRLNHSDRQKETAEWLIENGADMIVGSHPHVVQDSETINGVQVIYSLGNAVSNMSATNTQLGLMATIRIIRCGNGDLTVAPVEFTWIWCSLPGGYCDRYTVLPVERFRDRRHEWKDKKDYDKMIRTYDSVRKTTGID